MAVGVVLIVAAACLILPHVIDVQKYKPVLEQKIYAATGYPVSLGDTVDLSIFPSVGVSFDGLRLGNPEGFEGSDFVKIASFETKLRVMPLFSKKVEIGRFVIDGVEINLERTAEGRTNWDQFGKTEGRHSHTKEKAEEPSENGGFKLESLDVGEFAISNGRITFVDNQNRIRKEVSDLNVQLVDVNLERPVMAEMKVKIDGRPYSVSGQVGPIGKDPGQGRLPFALRFDIVEELQLHLKGFLQDVVSSPQYEFSLDAPSFSPRQLLDSLDLSSPLNPADDVFNSCELSIAIKGSKENVSIERGTIKLDDSTLSFSGKSVSLTPVHLVFEGNLDTFDLDRYFPVGQEETGEDVQSPQPGKETGRDYAPLRALTLDGAFTAGELKVHGGALEQIYLRLNAKDGVFRLDPLSVNLYEGTFTSSVNLDVRGEVPGTTVKMDVAGVHVGPLLRDFLDKDILEGVTAMQVEVSSQGDTPQAVKSSLTGAGGIQFQDGAIVGIDLAGMVRNVQSSFGLGATGAQRPKTDFAELNVPLTLTNGLFNTQGASLKSPFIRVGVAGNADLVTEALDMKVHPKFVMTMVGQGDELVRSGMMIPVIVSGTFNAPVFSPDLEEMAKSRIVEEGMKQIIGEEGNKEKIVPMEQVESIQKGLKRLLPKF